MGIVSSAKGFVNGFVLGMAASGRVEGAIAGGCVFAVFERELISQTEKVAAACLMGVHIASRCFLGADVSILTSFVMGGLNVESLSDLGTALLFAPGIYLSTAALAQEVFAKTSLSQSPFQECCVGEDFLLCSLTKGLASLILLTGIAAYSKECGRHLWMHRQFEKGQKRRMFVVSVVYFIGAICITEIATLVLRDPFGKKERWVIPLGILGSGLYQKYWSGSCCRMMTV